MDGYPMPLYDAKMKDRRGRGPVAHAVCEATEEVSDTLSHTR